VLHLHISCHHHHHHHHHRLYSPGWALVPSSQCRQQPLSRTADSQFLQPSFLASSSTPTFLLDFGRPCPHWPPGFVHNIFLGNLFSSIHTTWPAHLSLLDFITLTIFHSLSSSSSSLLYLFCHCPLSHIGPNILWRTFLSKIFSLLSSFFVVVQVSVAYVNFSLTSVWYTRIFVFLEGSCDLSWLFSPKYDLLAAIRWFVISSETSLLPVTNEPRQVKPSTLSKFIFLFQWHGVCCKSGC